MSAALVLPRVWASVPAAVVQAVERKGVVRSVPEVAFYRKYTESMLRRYMKMSMEAGRVPSMLGREMFRAKVTNYTVKSFEDVVIFVHDVEKCLAMLDFVERKLIERIALQEYTQGEAAGMMGLSIREVVRKYDDALDRLTVIFLKRRLLEPRIECQGTGSGSFAIND